jgi:hypothetical protein
MAITVLLRWVNIRVLPCTVKQEAECRGDAYKYFVVIEVMLSRE